MCLLGHADNRKVTRQDWMDYHDIFFLFIFFLVFLFFLLSFFLVLLGLLFSFFFLLFLIFLLVKRVLKKLECNQKQWTLVILVSGELNTLHGTFTVNLKDGSVSIDVTALGWLFFFDLNNFFVVLSASLVSIFIEFNWFKRLLFDKGITNLFDGFFDFFLVLEFIRKHSFALLNVRNEFLWILSEVVESHVHFFFELRLVVRAPWLWKIFLQVGGDQVKLLTLCITALISHIYYYKFSQ